MHSDIELLGLVADGDDGRFHFRVENHLARLDGRLYGGTAIAVSIAAAEVVSDRRALWMTTQFVATAPAHEEVSVLAEVLAGARRTNQVRVTGTDAAGATMFASLGATGRDRPGGLAGAFERPPEVDSPEDTDPATSPFAPMVANAGLEVEVPPLPSGVGFNAVVEYRVPTVRSHPDDGPGRVCLWARRRDLQPVTPTLVAYMADMVPLSIAAASGVIAGGISLDNTIRLGTFDVETEWVLIDLRPHLVAGDYGHGSAQIWSRDGRLLATASQSVSMFHFDPSDAPWHRRGRPG